MAEELPSEKQQMLPTMIGCNKIVMLVITTHLLLLALFSLPQIFKLMLAL